MNPRDRITRHVRGALEREPRINIHRHPLDIDTEERVVTLEGEVPDIAAKKLALELAAAVPGVEGVIDRLRIAPGERRGDGAIRDSLARLLLESRELADCSVHAAVNGQSQALRDLPQGSGRIRASIADGVIVLEGSVISLPHRLFAGALAWWTPGAREVLNALEVDPAYEPRDDEVTEALRLVLEADPRVDATQIRPNCDHRVVTLDGAVPSEMQKRQAELDAWCLAGVDRVVNRLQVAA